MRHMKQVEERFVNYYCCCAKVTLQLKRTGFFAGSFDKGHAYPGPFIMRLKYGALLLTML